MTLADLPAAVEIVEAPEVSKRFLILEIDLSQNSELRPALAALGSVNGWALSFVATDANTGEQFVVSLREAA